MLNKLSEKRQNLAGNGQGNRAPGSQVAWAFFNSLPSFFGRCTKNLPALVQALLSNLWRSWQNLYFLLAVVLKDTTQFFGLLCLCGTTLATYSCQFTSWRRSLLFFRKACWGWESQPSLWAILRNSMTAFVQGMNMHMMKSLTKWLTRHIDTFPGQNDLW